MTSGAATPQRMRGAERRRARVRLSPHWRLMKTTTGLHGLSVCETAYHVRVWMCAPAALVPLLRAARTARAALAISCFAAHHGL